MYFDHTFLWLLPAFFLAMWAQMRVKTTYARYAQVNVRSGLSGADVAGLILRDAGITLTDSPERFPAGRACGLAVAPGELTDNYNPRTRVLNLSQAVFQGRSISALGIAAHEVGHAIQHAHAYAPLALRNTVYPVCNIGSSLAMPMFFIGLFVGIPPLMKIGIVLFSAAVFFSLLTLPVEFNASRRALMALEKGGYLTDEELAGARAVLKAAAWTYVAAATMAVLNLIRLVALSNDRD